MLGNQRWDFAAVEILDLDNAPKSEELFVRGGWGRNFYGCGGASRQDANDEAHQNSHAWIVSESHPAKWQTVWFSTELFTVRAYTVVGMNMPQELA